MSGARSGENRTTPLSLDNHVPRMTPLISPPLPVDGASTPSTWNLAARRNLACCGRGLVENGESLVPCAGFVSFPFRMGDPTLRSTTPTTFTPIQTACCAVGDGIVVLGVSWRCGWCVYRRSGGGRQTLSNGRSLGGVLEKSCSVWGSK